MDFFDSFPAMERQDLRDLKKGIDSSFRDFSRAYGDEIEGFFEPLLHFLVECSAIHRDYYHDAFLLFF